MNDGWCATINAAHDIGKQKTDRRTQLRSKKECDDDDDDENDSVNNDNADDDRVMMLMKMKMMPNITEIHK